MVPRRPSVKSRVRRRSESRSPAVWLGDVGRMVSDNAPERLAHGSRSGVNPSWRIASGIVIVTMLAIVGLFFVSDVFYVHTVAVGGIQTLTKEEVFALTRVANYHIFWIDPEQVRENLLDSPTIADAEVVLGWPPQMLQVIIQEREPALIWEQAGTATWIDIQGRVMQLREDRTNLIKITYEGLADSALGPNDQIESDIVNGALQLNSLLGNGTPLRYSKDNGLGFRDERGWDAWFGIGTDMPNRVLIYNALVDNMLSRGLQPNVISVADPDSVYYAGLWGR